MADKWHGGMSDRQHEILWTIECYATPGLRDLVIAFADPVRWGRAVRWYRRTRAFDWQSDDSGLA